MLSMFSVNANYDKKKNKWELPVNARRGREVKKSAKISPSYN